MVRPVIVIFKSRAACEKFYTKLGGHKAYVFDAKDQVSLTNSRLDIIKDTYDAPHFVILTTPESSIGITFFPKAYVIMTEQPPTFTDYAQIMARSDRTDPDAPKYGALLSEKDTLSQVHLEEQLKSNERDFQLITRDYSASHKLIQEQIEVNQSDEKITNAVK